MACNCNSCHCSLVCEPAQSFISEANPIAIPNGQRGGNLNHINESISIVNALFHFQVFQGCVHLMV